MKRIKGQQPLGVSPRRDAHIKSRCRHGAGCCVTYSKNRATQRLQLGRQIGKALINRIGTDKNANIAGMQRHQLTILDGDRGDINQWLDDAIHTSLGQRIPQRLNSRAGSCQNRRQCHPRTASRMAAAPLSSSVSATCLPRASGSTPRPWAVNSVCPSTLPTSARSQNSSPSTTA